jgi:hypothetical protein
VLPWWLMWDLEAGKDEAVSQTASGMACSDSDSDSDSDRSSANN